MSRIILPIILTAAAFGGGWWLGAGTSEETTPAPAAGKSTPAAAKKPGAQAYGLARRAAMYRREDDSSLSETQRLLETRSLNTYQIDALFAKRVKQNPVGFWRWLESVSEDRFDLALVLGQFFNEWVKTDPDAALAALRSYSSRNFWPVVAEKAISGIFTADEKTRAKLLSVLDELVARGAGLIHRQGHSHEQAVQLLTLPASKGRDTLIMQAVSEWAGEDWSGVVKWSDTLTEPLKSAVTARLAARALDSSFLRDGTATRNAEVLARTGEWLKTASRETRQRMGSAYVQTLAPVDSATALAWAQENLQGAPLAKAVSEVLSQFAAQDPAETRAIVEQLPPGGLKTRALFAAAGKPGTEPAQWLLSRVDATAPEWTEFSAGWASRNPDDFRQFISSNGTEDLPEKLLRTGTRVLAGRDPAGTMTWAAGLAKNDVASIALDDWSVSDAAAAAAWIKDHPDVSLHASSLPSLADQYFRRSPAEALDWVMGLAPGPARDESITVIRKQISSNSSTKPDARAALEAKLNARQPSKP
jgi:hypothetical protein